jgi:hypothetical protein
VTSSQYGGFFRTFVSPFSCIEFLLNFPGATLSEMLPGIPLELLIQNSHATETIGSKKEQEQDETLIYILRVLIGILSDSQTLFAREMRERQWHLFEFQKQDQPICSVQECLSQQGRSMGNASRMAIDQLGQEQHHCQIIYTFVLGAYSNGTSTHFIQTIQGVPTRGMISTLRL